MNLHIYIWQFMKECTFKSGKFWIPPIISETHHSETHTACPVFVHLHFFSIDFFLIYIYERNQDIEFSFCTLSEKKKFLRPIWCLHDANPTQPNPTVDPLSRFDASASLHVTSWLVHKNKPARCRLISSCSDKTTSHRTAVTLMLYSKWPKWLKDKIWTRGQKQANVWKMRKRIAATLGKKKKKKVKTGLSITI